MKKNNATFAQFVYDGDGKRVKSVIDGETTLFIGNYYERKGSQVTKYYFAGATRIAMRKYTIPQNMTVEYLLGDHLGSASLTTDANGAKVSEIRYKPWGEVRYSWTSGQATAPAYTLPSYTFTGQYSYLDDPSTPSVTEGFGLMFYNARWYDPALGRFAQADTIVPVQTQGTQAWDRYAYVNNNPSTYTDPTGHKPCGELIDGNCDRFIPRSFAGVKREILSRHGVTLSDEILKWDYNNSTTILIALTQADTTFKAVCSQAGVAGCGTKSVFAGQSFYMESGGSGKWGGWWSNGKLKFHGNFPVELVLHELSG